MKNTLFGIILSVLLLTFLNSCSKEKNLEEIKTITKSVKEKYAPDGRVEIFNIQPEMEGEKIVLSGESTSKGAVENLMEQIENKNISVENNIEILPSADLGEKIYGIVNISVANLRSNPKHPAELVTQTLLGTSVNILKKHDGWYLIQTPDKYIAWVDDDGIIPVNLNELKNWKDSAKFILTEMFTSSFKSPNSKNEIVSDLVGGVLLKKISETNDFVKVQYPDGREAYVYKNQGKDYSKWLESITADENSIVKSAKLFMGLPYLWGGTSTKGVDCSGFTKTVYYLNGVLLPRDASQQVYVGDTVDTSNGFETLQRGDLLFFGRRASEDQKEKITHVAIYIGDNKYIHAAGKVKINSLSKNQEDFNEYRFNTFIRAKRILGSSYLEKSFIKDSEFYN